MRIGIFGGTFDPMHHGHIFAIAYALHVAHLDQCRVMVAGDPYHKNRDVTESSIRLRWVRETCDEYFSHDERVIVDDREVRRTGSTYTIDTVDELANEFPDAQYVLVGGEDIPSQIPTWKEGSRLADTVELCVVPRDVFTTSSSYIRSQRTDGLPITGLLPRRVEVDILENNHYRTT